MSNPWTRTEDERRITGWTAHVIEQLSANRLVRPLSNCTGVPQRDVVPLDRR